MASRLYRSTRGLYQHIGRHLRQLRVEEIGSPTFVALIALYVTGLIVLDTRQTQTRVTRALPGRCHDALNRLLREMSFSTRALMGLLVTWVKRQGVCGYLCLDDVIVEKAFAKRLRWAGWGYSFAKKRQVYGIHIIVCLWCSVDGQWRIPVAFRLRRPKRSVSPADYRTKVQLADAMITELLTAGLPFEYIVFDTHYTAGWFTKKLARRGICWQGTLNPRTHVIWRGRKQSVADLAPRLKLRWRQALQLRTIALRVYAPKYGYLRLVVTQNRHGNFEYLVSHERSLDLTTMALHCGVAARVLRKHSRWSVETLFRDTKQYAGLQACQCWVDQAMVRHVSLVLLTFAILQFMRQSADESVGAVKERWQLAILRSGEAPPAPLRACPPELRATAYVLLFYIIPSRLQTSLYSR